MDAQGLRSLRNQSIHKTLSAPRQVAEAAAELVRRNLQSYQQETGQEGTWAPKDRKSALEFGKLCHTCGVALQRERPGR